MSERSRGSVRSGAKTAAKPAASRSAGSAVRKKPSRTKTTITKESNVRKPRTAVKKVASKGTSVVRKPKSIVAQESLVLSPLQRTRAVVSVHSQFLPLELNRIMSQTARFAGVVCALAGAFFVLQYGSTSFNSVAALTVSQTAQVVSSTGGAQTTGGTSNTTQTTTAPSAYLELGSPTPLSGKVILRAVAPNAKKADFYIFSGSWDNKASLGTGIQVRSDVWEYYWDSTVVPDNTDYRFIAYVWDESAVTDRYDYALQLINYYTVLNEPTVTTQPTTTVNPDPAITLSTGAFSGTLLPVTVRVAGADSVTLRAENISTGVRYSLPRPIETNQDTWTLDFDTAGYPAGTYRLWARVSVNGLSYTSSDETITLTPPVKPGITTATDSTAATPPPVLPTLHLLLPQATYVSSNVTLGASIPGASQIHFYIQDISSAVPRYLGAATRSANTEQWYLNWYTPDVPNGTYKLFARAETVYGTIESTHEELSVRNALAPKATPESVALQADIEAISPLIETPEVIGAPPAEAVTATTTADSFFAPFEADFMAELQRLGTAIRSDDAAAELRIRERMHTLVERALATAPFGTDSVEATSFRDQIARRISTYLAEVVRVDTILAERQRVDVLQDSDRDGISDYDEATLYGTDPFAADTDGDGVIDGVEILDGYDPLNPQREIPIVFESALEHGEVRSDILRVETLLPIVAVETEASTTDTTSVPAAIFTGSGLPNSYVTLYIYSTPIVVTVKTDSDGTWRYRFDKELEDGDHQIYVGITDNAGRIIAKSEPFFFTKEAQALSPSVASVLNPQTPSPNGSLLDTYMIYLVLSISVVAIGLVLVLLGVHLDPRKRESYAAADTSSSTTV